MTSSAPARAQRPTGIRRWGGYIAFVVIFAIACGLLSWWQWDRRQEAIDRITLIEANWDAPPEPLAELLPTVGDVDPAVEWHPVLLQGEYLIDEKIFVRGRPRDGDPGFAQLVPFRLADGRIFVVDRGWLPNSTDGVLPSYDPLPVAGAIEVVVRLRIGEGELLGRGAPEGQLPTIHLPHVAAELAGVVSADLVDTGMYGLLVSENPVAAEEPPAPTLRPEADEGPHMSYALQWIMFGLIAIIGLVWAWRREVRIAALPIAEQDAARRARRNTRDDDEEDAILDAAEEHGQR